MKLDTRTALRIAVAVAALGYLGYTQLAKRHAAAVHAPAQAAPIAANAKEFTLGTLAFKIGKLFGQRIEALFEFDEETR